MSPALLEDPPEPPGPPAVALASLVLGVLALFLGPLLVGGVLALVGLGLGLSHLGRGSHGRSLAAWGSALSALGLLAALGSGYLYFTVYRSMTTEWSQDSEAVFEEWTGVAAPELSLTTVEGQALRLSELKGKRVVLDFWATWCGPCRREVPHFKRLAAESEGELVIVGISDEPEETLREFGSRERINYHVVSAEDLPPPFDRVTALPTTVFLDRQGHIQSVLVGYQSHETLKAHALAEDLPRAANGGDALP